MSFRHTTAHSGVDGPRENRPPKRKKSPSKPALAAQPFPAAEAFCNPVSVYFPTSPAAVFGEFEVAGVCSGNRCPLAETIDTQRALAGSAIRGNVRVSVEAILRRFFASALGVAGTENVPRKAVLKMAADATEQPARSDLDVRGVGVSCIDALDRRRRPFKRWEAIRGAVLSDMGGEANVSAVQRQLISKFATLAMRLEEMEASALAGQEIDVDLFGRCSGHLRRLAETLGLRRVPREVPDLHAYLESTLTEVEPA